MNINTMIKSKTVDVALKDLMGLAPKNAVIIDRYDKEKIIPINDLMVGDIFVVRAGDVVPADGVVIEGNASISETELTGRIISVNITIGDKVLASTINKSGYVKCRVTRLGNDSTLSQIIRTVSGACNSKAPVAGMADRISKIMIPVVLAATAITFIIWVLSGAGPIFAVKRALAVLLIAAPVAISLSYPIALIWGIIVASQNGILFKDVAALEKTGKTKIVALEKTGTITKGEPIVTDIFTVDSISRSGYSLINSSENELLKIAALLERKSDHPLAKAVVSYVGDLNAYVDDIEDYGEEEDITDFEVLPGHGLKGNYKGSVVVGASLKYISQICKIIPEAREKAVGLATQGKTPICIAKDNKLLGIIAVADPVKKDTAAAIMELKKMGIHVAMLTGDNQRTAMAIGDQTGVDEVASEILRDKKESVIKKLSEYGTVAMVGDGINDAPVLGKADAGIAIGAAFDVEIDSANVVLMKNTLRDVAGAIRLSRRVLSIIRQNVIFALICSIIGIVLASGLLIGTCGIALDPIVAFTVSIILCCIVIANSQKLKLFDIYNDRCDTAPKDVVTTEILTTEVMDEIRNSF